MMASIPSESWTWTLVDAAARSLMMAGVVGVGLRLLRVSHVMARKVAWTLVLGSALMMPMLAPWAENQQWLPFQAGIIPLQTLLNQLPARALISEPGRAAPLHHTFPTRAEALPVEGAPRVVVDQTSSRATAARDHFPAPAIALNREVRNWADGSRVPGSTPPWGGTLVMLYLGVAALLLIRVGAGCIATARLWLRAVPVADAVPDISGQAIRWSRDVSSPVTIGSGILLPEDYLSWDSEKLRIVLAHESSHVRQGDFYLQLLASLYSVVFWFSPLGWWLKRTLCDLSEAISDRAAVSEAATHASYAQVLLEFAALPRTTWIGVAMARQGRLSHRIERLLDESSFRRAFAGGRGRIVAAALLAPLALFAATSLIRVQAAGQEPPAAPAIPPAPASADVAPAAPGAPALPPAPGEATVMGEPPAAPAAPAAPTEPGFPPPGVRIVGGRSVGSSDSYSYSGRGAQSENFASDSQNGASSSFSEGHRYFYSDSDDGNSYAVIRGKDKDHITFSGDWVEGRREELDKAREMAHGDFLWFTHNGKAYVVDDPAVVGHITDMYKPMEELGRRQEELGRQQEELGRQQEELGEHMSEASIPAPDISREMAQLNAALAELNAAKGKNVTQEQLANLQDKLAEVQGRLGALQGEVGAKQGELGARQGELGAKQGKLGEQQGRLGEEQGRIAREVDRKVKSIIDESLKNGRARPVE